MAAGGMASAHLNPYAAYAQVLVCALYVIVPPECPEYDDFCLEQLQHGHLPGATEGWRALW